MARLLKVSLVLPATEKGSLDAAEAVVDVVVVASLKSTLLKISSVFFRRKDHRFKPNMAPGGGDRCGGSGRGEGGDCSRGGG